MRVGDFVVMGFFAEMKMRRDGMLEEMDEKISGEDENENARHTGCQSQRLGDHFEKGGGEHEARAECNEIFQVGARPLAADDCETADDIGGRGDHAQKQGEQNPRCSNRWHGRFQPPWRKRMTSPS